MSTEDPNPDVDPTDPEQETDPTREVDPDADTDTETDAAQFDAAQAREKIRKVNSENRNLRKRAADAEAKAKDSGEKDVRLTALEAENLRLRIGVKHGLPEALVKRLSGSTEEEIMQDAEELLELFGGGKKPATQQPKERLRGGGDPTQEPDKLDDLDKFAQDIFRN